MAEALLHWSKDQSRAAASSLHYERELPGRSSCDCNNDVWAFFFEVLEKQSTSSQHGTGIGKRNQNAVQDGYAQWYSLIVQLPTSQVQPVIKDSAVLPLVAS